MWTLSSPSARVGIASASSAATVAVATHALPSAPSSLQPNVYTVPSLVSATVCMPPVVIEMHFFPFSCFTRLGSLPSGEKVRKLMCQCSAGLSQQNTRERERVCVCVCGTRYNTRPRPSSPTYTDCPKATKRISPQIQLTCVRDGRPDRNRVLPPCSGPARSQIIVVRILQDTKLCKTNQIDFLKIGFKETNKERTRRTKELTQVRTSP
jgi:hypothetical protein